MKVKRSTRYYFSYKITTHQKAYATVEKETLGTVLAIEKFRVYLTSYIPPVEILTDHNPLMTIEIVMFRNHTRVKVGTNIAAIQNIDIAY